MKKIALALVAIVAALHVYIAWFEIFAWTSRGPAIFGSLPPELFAQTVDMAANQGVYNAFLAAGLIWSLIIDDETWQNRIATCFLMFVAVAGAVSAMTVAVKPGLFQLVPASVALLFLAVSKRNAAINGER